MVIFLFTIYVLNKIAIIISSILLKRSKKIIDPNRIICPYCKYVFSLYQKRGVFDIIKSMDDGVNVERDTPTIPVDVNLSCLKCHKKFHLTRKNKKFVNSRCNN